jgi:hypothetical protein
LPLVVAVECSLEDERERELALLDTAATWSILPPLQADALGLLGGDGAPLRVSSRLGAYYGFLKRLHVTLWAGGGVPVTWEVAFFVSEDWPGPLVLGWRGGLEHLRFAVDGPRERFHFGGPG